MMLQIFTKLIVKQTLNCPFVYDNLLRMALISLPYYEYVLIIFFFFFLQDNCKQITDKYVERDNVLITIDLLLHRPQVYRHLLINCYDNSSRFIEVINMKYLLNTLLKS